MGVGVHCLSLVEQKFILDLRTEDPTRSNDSYVAQLLLFSGNIVSSSFISSFFKKIGPFKANFKKLPTTPIDKYKPSNIKCYNDYLDFISIIPPHLLHFGDEKSLKGAEVFNRRGRDCPMTGLKAEVVVPSYFRNTYCIMGFVTIDRTKWPPFLYSIGEDNHDSACFLAFIINAVATGWLRRGDFIVIDNAILHTGGSCDILAEFLWNAPGLDGVPLNIVIVPFPTRAPELNPIEPCWNTFVKRLNMIKLSILNSGGGCEVYKNAACNVLNNFTHEDIEKNYVKQGYFGNQ